MGVTTVEKKPQRVLHCVQVLMFFHPLAFEAAHISPNAREQNVSSQPRERMVHVQQKKSHLEINPVNEVTRENESKMFTRAEHLAACQIKM